jgi:hypothetical protein
MRPSRFFVNVLSRSAGSWGPDSRSYVFSRGLTSVRTHARNCCSQMTRTLDSPARSHRMISSSSDSCRRPRVMTSMAFPSSRAYASLPCLLRPKSRSRRDECFVQWLMGEPIRTSVVAAHGRDVISRRAPSGRPLTVGRGHGDCPRRVGTCRSWRRPSATLSEIHEKPTAPSDTIE